MIPTIQEFQGLVQTMQTQGYCVLHGPADDEQEMELTRTGYMAIAALIAGLDMERDEGGAAARAVMADRILNRLQRL